MDNAKLTKPLVPIIAGKPAVVPPKPSIFFKEEFDLLIRNRQRVVYQGKAAAISTKNDGGEMDILPEHTHFISIIKEFVRVIKPDGTTQEFPLDTGVLKVYQNQVRIYLGIFSLNKKK